MKENDLLCPSAACTPDSFLLGILNASGKVDYTEAPIPLSGGIFESLRGIPSPEKHFRFTTRCHNNGCEQWLNGKCSVAAAFEHAKARIPSETTIPCSIQKACRWFYQEGIFACSVCKFIVTDTAP